MLPETFDDYSSEQLIQLLDFLKLDGINGIRSKLNRTQKMSLLANLANLRANMSQEIISLDEAIKVLKTP
jgi:hypothetical protein